MIPLSVCRAERDPAYPAVADERDPPFGRAVGEMRRVDVAAEQGNAAEGYRAQRAELCQDRLIELQEPPRLPRHFRGHPLVVRLAVCDFVEISMQRFLATGRPRAAPRCTRSPTLDPVP